MSTPATPPRRRADRLLSVRVWSTRASHAMDTAGIRVYAACIAYRTVYSVIAFGSTLVLLAGMLNIRISSRSTRTALASIPDDLRTIMVRRLEEATNLAGSHALIAGLIGLAFGVYGMAGGFAALADVLDRIHGTHTYHRLTIRYLRGALVAVVAVTFTTVGGVALAAGTSLGMDIFAALGLEWTGRITITVLRMAVVCASIVAAFAFLLRWGSHARPPWAEVITGAIVGAAGWIALTTGFFAVVTLMQPFSAYGAFASVIALLMFGNLQAYLLLMSALFGPLFASIPRALTGQGSINASLATERRPTTPGAP